jgi:predicted transcriptional regulator
MPATKKKNGRTVAIWMDEDLIARVDRLAEKADITRSKMMANMIEVTTKSLERADSFGIVSVALLLRDFEEGLRSWVREWKSEGPAIKEDWEKGTLQETTWE